MKNDTLAHLTFLNSLKHQVRDVTRTLDTTPHRFGPSLEATSVKHEVSILLSELKAHGLLPDVSIRFLLDASCPTIVCLCGSTRFSQAFQEAALRETLLGKIVVSIGCDTKSDAGLCLGSEVKTQLDELHLRKIDLSDEVLILNVGGYIGESTSREIAYADTHAKSVRFLEPVDFDVFRAEGQGRCARCADEACWLRLESGRSVPIALCDRHAWVSKGRVS